MTAYRDFGRKQKREVSLEYLISETPLEPFTTDTYFEQYDQPTVFAVKGQEIVVASNLHFFQSLKAWILLLSAT